MTKNEADFCEYFYRNVVLESYYEIPSDVIKECKRLLTGSSALCGGCYKSELIEMNNIWGSWKTAWDEYKEQQRLKMVEEPIKTMKKNVKI